MFLKITLPSMSKQPQITQNGNCAPVSPASVAADIITAILASGTHSCIGIVIHSESCTHDDSI